jgi:hypothetical protein
MQGGEVDYLSYPIIVVNPDKDTSSWLADLQKGFLFHIIPKVQDYSQVLVDREDAVAIVFDQIDQDEQFLTFIKGQTLQVKTFALLSSDQSGPLKDLIPCSASCQPLFKPCQPEILRLEFAHSIERHRWNKERELLFSMHRQENWFSLIGQLTREWAHEIRNRAAIISLNAEISMTKVRKHAPKSLNLAETMEKIIEQCLKISKILDSVRELSDLGQNNLFPASLMEIIDHAIFLIKSEVPGIPIHIEKRTVSDLSLSIGESIRLRSALVNILRYYSGIEDGSSPIMISVEDNQGFHLKIRIEDAEAVQFDSSYVDGPLQNMLGAEPKLLDFIIGIRLLKSLGGDISIDCEDFGREIVLAISLPSDFKQRPLYHE